MRALTARALLQVWEWGDGWHPIDQALAILHAAFPEKPRDELTTLSLSQRDGLLLALRKHTFGPHLQGFAQCPTCGESLEFSLDLSSLPAPHPLPGEQTLAVDGYEIHFRTPNTLDLAAMARQTNVETATATLLNRLVTRVCQGNTEIPLASLPPACVQTLEDHLTEHDPLLDMQLAMECPACHHQWSVVFDILTFFWTEIAAHARRLLGEVHALAQAYGWYEDEILSLSDRRRKMYLQMVTP